MAEERRRVPRFSLHLRVGIKLPGEANALTVKLENMCALGCLLEYAPNLEPQQECEFFMPWKGREFRSRAVVAWKGESGQVGLEFLNTDAENFARLREICAELLMKPLVRLSSREQEAG